MVAAQRALNRATKTLAAMPKIRQQRQKFLQQPQKFVNAELSFKYYINFRLLFLLQRNIITRTKIGGGGVRKRYIITIYIYIEILFINNI